MGLRAARSFFALDVPGAGTLAAAAAVVAMVAKSA